MRYYNFLNENRTEQITVEQFENLLDKNCSQFLKTNCDIFRGLKKSLIYGYIDPTKSTRVSKNADNYYTILFDEILPSWKGWPKRSKSIICSSSEKYAATYGNIFYIYPYNNSKIGVCSEDDIWFSFTSSFPRDLQTITEILKRMANVFDHDLKETKESLLKLFEIIDSYNISFIMDKLIEAGEYSAFDLLKKKGNKTTLEHFDKMFDPNNNDLNKYSTSNYKHHRDKEVWIEGPCLLVSEKVK